MVLIIIVPMSISAISINHRSAPIKVRESFSVSEKQQSALLEALLSNAEIEEAFLLSTCHRTEVYCKTSTPAVLAENLTKHYGIDSNALLSCSDRYQGQDVIQHLIRVASGLDSMVLGEPQILGQMKTAYRLAEDRGTLGGELRNILQFVFSASKKIRHDTEVGRHPLSLAYVTVLLSKQIFTDIKKSNVLLIGTGETIDLVAQHFASQGIQQLYIAGRTLEKADALALKHQAQAIRLSDIPAYLPLADIVISATRSDLPLIGKGAVQQALKQRKRKPMLLVDLANPRDIEPEIEQLEDIYLYNLDDLGEVIKQNLSERQQAALEAESMVDTLVDQYLCDRRVQAAGQLIQAYREHGEQVRDDVLSKMRDKLQKGYDPDDALVLLAHTLTNKLLHNTTVQLQKAAYQDEQAVLDWVKQHLVTEA